MGKKSVLVIADKHSHKFYSTLSLRGEKIRVTSPKDSLMSLKNDGADIVILDSGNDSVRGIKLLKEIKSLSENTPVIMLTDVSSDDIGVKAFKSGVRDYFKKPVNLFELINSIENLLTVKRTSTGKRSTYGGNKEVTNNQYFETINTDLPAHILRVVNLIQENFSQKLSLDILAKEANLSKYQFCRTFRNFVGLTPMEFVRVLRVQKSKELLRGNDLTISRVASEVGFPDVSSFGRAFKKISGMTPGAYRKSFLKKL
jgi:AraC family transcriptional regulator